MSQHTEKCCCFIRQRGEPRRRDHSNRESVDIHDTQSRAEPSSTQHRRATPKPDTHLGVGVQLQHGAQVAQRVLLERRARVVVLGRLDDGLDLVAVDDAVQVRVRHHAARNLEALLLRAGGVHRAEDAVQLGERALGPNAEAAHVAARRQLQQVQALHVRQLNARDVAERVADAQVVDVHHQRAAAHRVATVAHLALALVQVLARLALERVSHGAHLLQQRKRGGRLAQRLSRVGDDQRHLRHAVDLVAASHDEARQRRGGQRGGDGVALLLDVDLAVPPAPDLRGEAAGSDP